MRDELNQSAVLAMYDVRGIQSYIFRTNEVREIIGASNIVDDIVIKALNSIRDVWSKEKGTDGSPKIDASKYLTDWQHEDASRFDKEPEIQMQVIFIGGGNAYVLFRTGEECGKWNRALGKYVLENTYSLQLAVAAVKKTESYKNDYAAIQEEMIRVKASMPAGRPAGALPFMQTDPMTGFPLHKLDENNKKYGAYLSEESLLKCKARQKEGGDENIHDNLVTEKGTESLLAVVHIDGNNMGNRIIEIMRGKNTYEEAAETIQTISRSIVDGFGEAYKKMCEYIDTDLKLKVKKASSKTRDILIRRIILAGDDITFICNARVAIPAVRQFFEVLSGKCLYYEQNKMNENQEKAEQVRITDLQRYALSACAGIAFCNSHFPFSDAYQVAEACCSSAKSVAKESTSRDGHGNIGNFLDFQMCTNVSAADLKKYRTKHYYKVGGGTLIRRPYYVGCKDQNKCSNINEVNQARSIENLIASVKEFKPLPRSQAKALREACAKGDTILDGYCDFLASRQKEPKTDRAFWYDALEIIDFYVE